MDIVTLIKNLKKKKTLNQLWNGMKTILNIYLKDLI